MRREPRSFLNLPNKKLFQNKKNSNFTYSFYFFQTERSTNLIGSFEDEIKLNFISLRLLKLNNQRLIIQISNVIMEIKIQINGQDSINMQLKQNFSCNLFGKHASNNNHPQRNKKVIRVSLKFFRLTILVNSKQILQLFIVWHFEETILRLSQSKTFL